MKGEKQINPMNFEEYLIISQNSLITVYYDRFLWNELYERYCYISKSRQDKLLHIVKSMVIRREMNVELDNQSFF